MRFLLPILLAAAGGFSGSDRAALNLAIAGTRHAPPDLSALIVRYRKEFLTGVREAAHQPAPADLEKSARAISRAILARTPFPEIMKRTGAIVGSVLSAEAPDGSGPLEEASAGPYRFSGVNAAAAAGDPSAVARSVAAAGKTRPSAPPSAEAIASRIVSDETNLLWAIWVGAGGDARSAGKFDERNGPYVIPAGSR